MDKRMRENLRTVGSLGESIAAMHLERHGYRIIERNWTARAAEIDIVAADTVGRRWFFEVKFRRSQSHWTAAEALTMKKRRDFIRAAYLYCHKHGVDPDAIGIGFIAIDAMADSYRLMRIPIGPN